MLKPSTYFALMAEFNTAHIPITEIGKKYFGYDDQKSKTTAAKSQYPFPVFRVGTQKSVWMVDIAVMAEYLDKVKEKANQEYKTAKLDS